MALLTLTINNLSPALDKQVHEVERIGRLLNLAAHNVQAGGGTVTSGNLTDGGPQGVVVLGSWTYTPQATS